MGFLNHLEKFSEKLIEGFFKGKFKGQLQPIEIAKKLAREMGARKTVSISRIYVPNEYTVLVSAEDWANLSVFEEEVVNELQQYLVGKARDKGYALATPPVVKFQVKEELALGIFEIESRFVEPPEGMPRGFELEETREPEVEGAEEEVPQHTQVFQPGSVPLGLFETQAGEGRPELIILRGSDPGMTFRLGQHRMVIGRRETNHIFLDDHNISRRHAQLDYIEGSYYISDLGSTNGTFVNDRRVEKQRLEPGGRICLGTTELEFRVV
ncbi:MAG: DUF3662 and FHA domain-containing protein [Clostridia bacterium]|nr:DUF3662 and FHA domain-containing protein [Clostridia bacterium]